MHIILNLVALSQLQSLSKSCLAFLKNLEKKSTVIFPPLYRNHLAVKFIIKLLKIQY